MPIVYCSLKLKSNEVTVYVYYANIVLYFICSDLVLFY